MAANLKVTHYRNGDQIPYATDNSEWSGLTRGAYCVYDNDESHADNCGYLYNWHAVNDCRNIAPHEWHVPADQDWKDLEISLGMGQSDADGQKLRGRNEGGKLKAVGTSHWDSPNEGATNESGFSALPGGFRTCIKGSSSERGAFSSSLSSNAAFWSATEYNQQNAWYRYLNFNYSDVGRNFTSKKNGFSIRLVKD